MKESVFTQNISPDDARKMLEMRHPNQREASSQYVHYYAGLMARGEFIKTGDAIMFDKDGFLVNGQHRLMAVIKSGTSQDFVVMTGADKRALLEAIDQNKARTTGDLLTMRGNIPSAKDVASITTAIFRFDNGLKKTTGGGQTKGHARMSAKQIADFYHKNEEILSRSVRIGKRLSSKKGTKLFSSISLCGMLAFIIMRENESGDYFFDRLGDGICGERDSIIFVLREVLTQSVIERRKYFRDEIAEFVFRAFNLWVRGVKAAKRSVAKSEGEFPAIIQSRLSYGKTNPQAYLTVK